MSKRSRTIIAIAVIILVSLVAGRERLRFLFRVGDTPPTVEFTFIPSKPISLHEVTAKVRVKDDHAIDFTTYRMTLVELERTLVLPIPGLVGKEYEQPVSFSLVADDPRIREAGKLTVIISVADDRGQSTEITRFIPLR